MPVRTQPIIAAMIAACLLALVGCARIQPQVATQLPETVPAAWVTAQKVQSLPISASLLELIDAPALETIVAEALESNPDLRATALRLRADTLRLSAPRSRLLPALNAGFSKGRDNQGIDPVSGGRLAADSHRLGLNLSWEIDLWGRLADESAAAGQQVLAGEADFQAARDALAARVIQAWLVQVARRQALAIEEERVQVLEQIEAVLIERYRTGIGSLDEFSTAKSRTQIALADRSAQQAGLRRSMRKLELLVGRPPKAALSSGDDWPAVALPSVDAPLTVLARRPDVQAAVARLAASGYLARSAKKAMLPEVQITAGLFRSGARLTDLSGATSSWSLLGSLLQPLFAGGRLLGEARAQESEAEAARMDLCAVVLRALGEVENALDADRELAVQIAALEKAVDESAASSRYFAQRYRQGLDNLQSLLIAKEQEMIVRQRLNQLRADRLNNRIDLALAAGVGLTTAGDEAGPALSPRTKAS